MLGDTFTRWPPERLEGARAASLLFGIVGKQLSGR
jgi:hypothetical protein